MGWMSVFPSEMKLGDSNDDGKLIFMSVVADPITPGEFLWTLGFASEGPLAMCSPTKKYSNVTVYVAWPEMAPMRVLREEHDDQST